MQLMNKTPDNIQQYKSANTPRDPYQYVRQRNAFWGNVGDIFTNLISGYVFFNLIKGVIIIAFVIAVIKALAS